MRVSPPELYTRVSDATTRLQDDGGVFRRFVEKHELDRVEYWLLTRYRYFPGSVTPNDFLTFGPYTSVSKYQGALESLADKKMVERAGEGRYKLVDAARKAIVDVYNDYFARVARSNALADEEGQTLYGLIERVYTAALRQSEVPTPILNAAHSVLPETDSIWVQLERRLVGLMIYRDESHMAAWREAGYTGPRIELSTQLYEAAEGLSHAALREAASRLDDKDFVSALSALHSGGEVVQRADQYRLSTSGRQTRDEIEAATDQHFERPFGALGEDEFDAMLKSMERLAGVVTT
jgi:hypothetical protein